MKTGLRYIALSLVSAGYWLTIVPIILWMALAVRNDLPGWAADNAPWLVFLALIITGMWAATQVIEGQWRALLGVVLAWIALGIAANFTWLETLLETLLGIGVPLLVIGLSLQIVLYALARQDRASHRGGPPATAA